MAACEQTDEAHFDGLGLSFERAFHSCSKSLDHGLGVSFDVEHGGHQNNASRLKASGDTPP